MTEKIHSGGRLVIIDAYGLFNRAFYALPGLTTSSGQPTGAVYGVAAMLIRLLAEERPDYVAVALDVSGPTVRHEQYQQYKEGRRPMPDDLRAQVPYLLELMQAMGLTCFSLQGHEADDIAGTLAKVGEQAGMRVTLVTGDKDLLQLVSDRTEAILTRRGISETDRYDAEAVKDLLGVPPEAVADFKGLSGDKSDNIPGVPGIGPKTAAKLLQRYGTLEAVLQNVQQIKGKVGQALGEHAQAARLSKELATIKTDLPLDLDWDKTKFDTPVSEDLLRLFDQLEFARLKAELQKRFPDVVRRLEPLRTHQTLPTECQVVTPENLATWAESWQNLDGEALITVSPDGEALVLAHIAGRGGGQKVVACVIPSPVATSRGSAIESVLGQSGLLWLAHDAKRVILHLHDMGISPPEFRGDLLLASYLLGPGKPNYALPTLIDKHLNESVTWNLSQEAQQTTGKVCEAAFRLGRSLHEAIEKEGLREVYRNIELPLVPVLARMEITGVKIDTGFLAALSDGMEAELHNFTRRIYDLAGHEFNINSPKQLATVLFEELGLPIKKKTKSGPSTDAAVLEELKGAHPIVEIILAYRQAVKLKGTYVDTLPSLVRSQTGRVHTSFNQAVAATGRLSSVNPNLQNIPIRTDAGREIRKAFVPGHQGYVLLSLDYSQIELRILAHIAQDDRLITAFREGSDIHTTTAAEIFGVPQDSVTAKERSAAKAVNFGIVYGISSFGLAKGTGLSMAASQEYIDKYFERYPKVKEYMTRVVDDAKRHGYVQTLSGRKRWLPDLKSKSWARRSLAQRAALNTPIQGTAADIIKLAMIQTDRMLRTKGYEAAMLLQVHDELVLECAQDQAVEVAQAVRGVMERAFSLSVPLPVHATMGPNWLEMKEIDEHA